MSRTAAFLFSMVLLGGCDGDPSPPMDSGPSTVDAGTPMEDAGTDAGTAPPDTWSTYAMGFFATYCTRCHSGGTRDYRTIDEVRRDASTIICGVSPVVEAGCGPFPPPSQFPIGSGPFPDNAERTRIVAWLNAGLPE